MPKETLTSALRRLAEQFGGADEAQDFVEEQLQNYCDKGDHLLRSLANAPQHAEHWKKEAKKRWNPLWGRDNDT